MTQSIVIQVGQCGNQIGCRFWDLALREHAQYSKAGAYDEPLSSFFRNTDTRHGVQRDIPLGEGKGRIGMLKARVSSDCVLFVQYRSYQYASSLQC
ncbi:Tubulin epsilon chain, partial [Geodia barretti]